MGTDQNYYIAREAISKLMHVHVLFNLQLQMLYFYRLYTKKQPVTSIKHWPAPQGRYVPFEEAIKGDYSDVEVGQSYGPT